MHPSSKLPTALVLISLTGIGSGILWSQHPAAAQSQQNDPHGYQAERWQSQPEPSANDHRFDNPLNSQAIPAPQNPPPETDAQGFRPLELQPTDPNGQMPSPGNNPDWPPSKTSYTQHGPGGSAPANTPPVPSPATTPALSPNKLLPPPPSNALQLNKPSPYQQSWTNPPTTPQPYPNNRYARTPNHYPSPPSARPSTPTNPTLSPSARLSEQPLIDAQSYQRLSDADKKQLRHIQRQARRQRHALIGEAMLHNDQLEDLLDNDRPDPDAVGKVYAKLFDVERRQIELRIRTQNRVKDLITRDKPNTTNKHNHDTPSPSDNP